MGYAGICMSPSSRPACHESSFPPPPLSLFLRFPAVRFHSFVSYGEGGKLLWFRWERRARCPLRQRRVGVVDGRTVSGDSPVVAPLLWSGSEGAYEIVPSAILGRWIGILGRSTHALEDSKGHCPGINVRMTSLNPEKRTRFF